MTLKVLQNFYKAIVTTAFDAGDLKMYVDTLPTPTVGYVVINPSNSTKREIVLYSAIGNDGGGNFLTLTTRGIGVTTDQAHDINEPVRMNLTAEHYAEIQDELDTKPTISSGAAAPVTTPSKVGDIYIETTTPALYFSAGTVDSDDWILTT